ncbi:hypothetical protein FO519_000061 [Halicephalobus sp. NKZ332]|nr:hypothetical protein FO519_000061 [Halicephalobus sp. NKZ332]
MKITCITSVILRDLSKKAHLKSLVQQTNYMNKPQIEEILQRDEELRQYCVSDIYIGYIINSLKLDETWLDSDSDISMKLQKQIPQEQKDKSTRLLLHRRGSTEEHEISLRSEYVRMLTREQRRLIVLENESLESDIKEIRIRFIRAKSEKYMSKEEKTLYNDLCERIEKYAQGDLEKREKYFLLKEELKHFKKLLSEEGNEKKARDGKINDLRFAIDYFCHREEFVKLNARDIDSTLERVQSLLIIVKNRRKMAFEPKKKTNYKSRHDDKIASQSFEECEILKINEAVEEDIIYTVQEFYSPSILTYGVDIEEKEKILSAVYGDQIAPNNEIDEFDVENLLSIDRGKPKITQLILSHNQISRFGRNAGFLMSLVILKLDHNQLESLPSDMGGIKNLVELHLGHNRLRSLPRSLRNLTNLQILNIENNLFTNEDNLKKNLWLRSYLYLQDNDNLTHLPFLPDTAYDPAKANLSRRYLGPNDYSITEKRYPPTIVMLENKFISEKRIPIKNRKPNLPFNECKIENVACNCCAECSCRSDNTKKVFVEQVVVMDFAFHSKEYIQEKNNDNEKETPIKYILDPGNWKSEIRTILCENCISKVKKRLESVVVSVDKKRKARRTKGKNEKEKNNIGQNNNCTNFNTQQNSNLDQGMKESGTPANKSPTVEYLVPNVLNPSEVPQHHVQGPQYINRSHLPQGSQPAHQQFVSHISQPMYQQPIPQAPQIIHYSIPPQGSRFVNQSIPPQSDQFGNQQHQILQPSHHQVYLHGSQNINQGFAPQHNQFGNGQFQVHQNTQQQIPQLNHHQFPPLDSPYTNQGLSSQPYQLDNQQFPLHIHQTNYPQTHEPGYQQLSQGPRPMNQPIYHQGSQYIHQLYPPHGYQTVDPSPSLHGLQISDQQLHRQDPEPINQRLHFEDLQSMDLSYPPQDPSYLGQPVSSQVSTKEAQNEIPREKKNELMWLLLHRQGSTVEYEAPLEPGNTNMSIKEGGRLIVLQVSPWNSDVKEIRIRFIRGKRDKYMSDEEKTLYNNLCKDIEDYAQGDPVKRETCPLLQKEFLDFDSLTSEEMDNEKKTINQKINDLKFAINYFCHRDEYSKLNARDIDAGLKRVQNLLLIAKNKRSLVFEAEKNKDYISYYNSKVKLPSFKECESLKIDNGMFVL